MMSETGRQQAPEQTLADRSFQCPPHPTSQVPPGNPSQMLVTMTTGDGQMVVPWQQPLSSNYGEQAPVLEANRLGAARAHGVASTAGLLSAG